MDFVDTSMSKFCILLAGFMLLPLIPSILIYRIFPKDRVRIIGPLNGLSINATGAFAGYIICCLLSFPLVFSIRDSILMDQQKDYSWKIKAKVSLLKPNGEALDDEEMQKCLSELKLLVKPDIIRSDINCVSLYLPQSLIDQSTINFAITGFIPAVIRIEDIEDVHRNNIKKIIDLKTIELKQFKNKRQDPYNYSVGNVSLVTLDTRLVPE